MPQKSTGIGGEPMPVLDITYGLVKEEGERHMGRRTIQFLAGQAFWHRRRFEYGVLGDCPVRLICRP